MRGRASLLLSRARGRARTDGRVLLRDGACVRVGARSDERKEVWRRYWNLARVMKGNAGRQGRTGLFTFGPEGACRPFLLFGGACALRVGAPVRVRA
jgi:hypothetical protein